MGKRYEVSGEKLQEALTDQMVKCGIFVENTPVKTTGCYVNYKNWEKAKDDQNVSVITEGQTTFTPKKHVKILEDLNQFANIDDYVEGVELNAEGEATSNILIHAVDYTEATGNSDEVRIIRGPESENPQVDTVPKANIKTLSV
jgi:hypothetical protein